MPIQSKNPSTEEVFKTFEEISDESLEQKLEEARSAFLSWKDVSYKERGVLIKKLGSYLREHSDEFSKMQTLEMGKTFSSGRGSMEKCAATCDYYAENAEDILKNQELASADEERFVRYDPLGTILGVMPWNFPFWQVYRFAVPVIMAGNTAVLKHASNVQGCAQMIEDSFVKCGFPKGVFQNLCISSPRVEKVLRDTRIMGVALTGSENAGSSVASIAGSEIKKTVMELGGTDVFMVFPDADVKHAVENALYARLQDNTGQSCIAGKRFIIHKDIVEEFINLIKENLETLIIGDPMDEKTNVGPLATEQGLNEIIQQVNDSIAQGATLVYGGKRYGDKGYFYMPTILTNVKKGMVAYDQEIFGPVFSIITFETEEEAVQMANENPYGLGAAFFTKDRERINRLVPQIEAGNVFVNRFVKSDIRMPFGGIKKSGYGRELGSDGIKEFVNIKNVCIK